MLRSTSDLGSRLRGTRQQWGAINHSPWHIQVGCDTKKVPFLLVIYFSNLKKKGVRSDASSMIAIFIEFVIPIPNFRSFSFFFNLPYRAASHRLKLVKVCLKGPQGTDFVSVCSLLGYSHKVFLSPQHGYLRRALWSGLGVWGPKSHKWTSLLALTIGGDQNRCEYLSTKTLSRMYYLHHQMELKTCVLLFLRDVGWTERIY